MSTENGEPLDPIERHLREHDERFDQHDERFHRIEIKLEKIEDDIRLVLEGMQTGFDSLRRDLQQHIDELKTRLDVVEGVVRNNGRNITFLMAAVEENSSELRELRTAVERVEAKLDTKPDRAEVDAIEARVSALEANVLGKSST